MNADTIDALQADWRAQGMNPDDHALGIVLRVQALARHLSDQLSERLGELGLNWWQYDVLSALRRQGPPYVMSATELAEAGQLTSGALTTRIDRLLEAGLVVRRRDREDRRRVLIGLSQRGRAQADDAAKVRFDAARAAMEGLDSDQKRQFNDLLRLLLSSPD